MEQTDDLKPMPLWLSLVIFGIAAALWILATPLLVSMLESAGLKELTIYCVTILLLAAILIAAGLAAFRLEGNPWSWSRFKYRFRLHTVASRYWLAAAAVIVATQLLIGFISPAIDRMMDPDTTSVVEWHLATDDPTSAPEKDSAERMGGDPAGTVAALGFFSLVSMVGVLADELWWRGYVLPRQELVHGRHTWLIHGVLWTVFHTVNYWRYPELLPVGFAAAYVAQRLGSTLPAAVLRIGWGAVVMTLMILLPIGSG